MRDGGGAATIPTCNPPLFHCRGHYLNPQHLEAVGGLVINIRRRVLICHLLVGFSAQGIPNCRLLHLMSTSVLFFDSHKSNRLFSDLALLSRRFCSNRTRFFESLTHSVWLPLRSQRHFPICPDDMDRWAAAVAFHLVAHSCGLPMVERIVRTVNMIRIAS